MRPLKTPYFSSYLSDDTIVSVASGLGGAVAIIRISGLITRKILDQIVKGGFFEPSSLSDAQTRRVHKEREPRKLYLCELIDKRNEPLDSAMVVFFKGTSSYTGEESAEIHIHGGSLTATRVIESLLAFGARQAQAGEFSFRAVRNGKMNITQAQAVADLIAAENESAASLALEKMAGSQNDLLAKLSTDLRQLAMLGEVGIDFSDQDVDEVSLPRLKQRLQSIVNVLITLKASYDRGSKIQDGIRVAFVGLPNAGKSSFFNALLGEDRSIVSDVAGTTRDVIRERLTLRSHRHARATAVTLRLEDTAGLRASEDKIEREGVARSERSAREAELILFVVDGSSSAQQRNEIQEQWGRMGRPHQKTIGIIAKTDLLTEAHDELLKTLDFLEIETWAFTSARSLSGVSEASDQIVGFCEKWVHRSVGEVVLTRLDHVQAVELAVGHLERAKDASELDLFASDVRQALSALGGLIGETLPDDILGAIFSTFCIGK